MIDLLFVEHPWLHWVFWMWWIVMQLENHWVWGEVWRDFWIINRPSVAGPVLQTPLSLINWLTHSTFMEISPEHLHSQTVRDRELKFWDKVHLPLPAMCHLSHVICHLFFFFFFFLQSGETSRWRVCYQRVTLSSLMISKLLVRLLSWLDNYTQMLVGLSQDSACPMRMW